MHQPHRTPPAPFPTAQAAWLWTAASLAARTDPTRKAPPPGPCRPEDVIKCLDGLYRRRRIELIHARTLHFYATTRGRAPDPARDREYRDWVLWQEAIGRLEYPLRQRGIVCGESAGVAMAVAAE